MARVSNPLIGKSSGSVGGVTFSSWKGIDVIKAKPTVVANPQTDAQKAQRSAFSQMVAIYRLMVAVLVLGFKELAVKKSAFNAFTSVNLKNAFNLSAPPAATLVPASILISKGTISATSITDVVLSRAANTAAFTYPNTNALPGQSATDRPLMAVYNATKDEWISGVGTQTRADGADSLVMPAGWEAGDTFHAYLGFTNVEGDQASDSQYLTDTVEA